VTDPNPFGYGMVKGASALHATASMDCLMQVSGESVFVLEDTEIRLQPGDWLIVNGVPHSCRNDLDRPAVLVGVVIGARHDGIPLRTH
jgi:mannose-6-phosphate isomerase-like protein (cupin superfamily)